MQMNDLSDFENSNQEKEQVGGCNDITVDEYDNDCSFDVSYYDSILKTIPPIRTTSQTKSTVTALQKN